MSALFGFCVFFFGLGAGSFLNVVLLRLNTGQSVFLTRSRCFHCGKVLSWFELIPLASFFLQAGRCRGCQSKISWQYPLVEFAVGALFLLLYAKWLFEFGSISRLPILLWWFIVAWLLVALSVYDLRHKILPDRFTYAFIVASFAGFVFFRKAGILHLALSLLPAALLFSLWLFSRGRWMGLGDVKLMAGAAFFLPWPQALAALVISFWAGALVGIGLLLFYPGITLKSEIPFGPFLILGILAAFFSPHLFPAPIPFYGIL